MSRGRASSMPEYVVTSPGGWAGWRIVADSPKNAAVACAMRDLHVAVVDIEQAPAPWPAEWIVIDVDGARLGEAMAVQAHRFRRRVKP